MQWNGKAKGEAKGEVESVTFDHHINGLRDHIDLLNKRSGKCQGGKSRDYIDYQSRKRDHCYCHWSHLLGVGGYCDGLGSA